MPETPRPLTAAELSAYLSFTEVSALLRPAVEKQLKDVGALSYVQFQLLARLGDTPSGSRSMTDLADGVVYSRSGLTYQAQLLDQRGLVSRSASPEDERRVVVTITDAGREVLAAVFPGHIALVRELLFASLSDDETEALAGILGTVAGRLREAPPRSAAPRRRKAT